MSVSAAEATRVVLSVLAAKARAMDLHVALPRVALERLRLMPNSPTHDFFNGDFANESDIESESVGEVMCDDLYMHMHMHMHRCNIVFNKVSHIQENICAFPVWVSSWITCAFMIDKCVRWVLPCGEWVNRARAGRCGHECARPAAASWCDCRRQRQRPLQLETTTMAIIRHRLRHCS